MGRTACGDASQREEGAEAEAEAVGECSAGSTTLHEDQVAAITTGTALNTASSSLRKASPRFKRLHLRNNYFLPGDLVWVRPAKLPYWPAEVIESDEPCNRVRARLLHPPKSQLLAANLEEERRIWTQVIAKRQQHYTRLKQKGPKVAPSEGNEEPVTTQGGSAAPKTAAKGPPIEADVVTANGLRVFFFDKLTTTEEFDACVEFRLKRETHVVTAYEAEFLRAVLQANRLVRINLDPEKLKPYAIRGVGVVHSLMRTHISAPRQPHTPDFEPQTAVIRLRVGLENAARDLVGFEYIWVLFQFSYAAALATGEGQDFVKRLREQGQDCNPTGDAAGRGSSGLGVVEEAEDVAQQLAQSQSGSLSAAPDLVEPQSCGWLRRQGITNARCYKTMVIPPRDDEFRGVFATRSPHRPNFIGMSCVRLIAVHGLDIHIADHDLLHGTPVLDIKPYLPFCDAHPDARMGWVEELESSGKQKADHKYKTQAAQVDRIFDPPSPVKQKDDRN